MVGAKADTRMSAMDTGSGPGIWAPEFGGAKYNDSEENAADFSAGADTGPVPETGEPCTMKQ